MIYIWRGSSAMLSSTAESGSGPTFDRPAGRLRRKARSRRRSTRPYSCALGGAAPASERTLCRAALLLGRTRLRRRFRRLGLHRSLLLLVLVLLTLVTHHAVLSQGPIRGAAIGRGRVVCGFERIVRICISVYLRSIDPVTIGPARQRSLRVLSDGRWLLLHPCVPMIHLAKEEL